MRYEVERAAILLLTLLLILLLTLLLILKLMGVCSTDYAQTFNASRFTSRLGGRGAELTGFEQRAVPIDS